MAVVGLCDPTHPQSARMNGAPKWRHVSFVLLELVAVGCFEGEAVESSELLDLFERLGREGGFAFEGVQDDAFELVAEAEVFELR